jgi:hypothetical protein
VSGSGSHRSRSILSTPRGGGTWRRSRPTRGNSSSACRARRWKRSRASPRSPSTSRARSGRRGPRSGP